MSDSPSQAAGLLDYDQLEPFVEIGFEEFSDILDGMLVEAPVVLGSLAASLRANDAVAGKAQAHSLRGMLLNFGCTAIAAKLAHIERAPVFPGGDPATLIAELNSLWERTRIELQEWAAAQSGSSSAG